MIWTLTDSVRRQGQRNRQQRLIGGQQRVPVDIPLAHQRPCPSDRGTEQARHSRCDRAAKRLARDRGRQAGPDGETVHPGPLVAHRLSAGHWADHPPERLLRRRKHE